MKVNNYIIGKSKRAKGIYIFAGISGGYGAGTKKQIGLGWLEQLEQINPDVISILKTKAKELTEDMEKDFVKQELLNSIQNQKITVNSINYGIEVIYKFIDKLQIFESISKTKHKDLKSILEYCIASRIINSNSIIRNFEIKDNFINTIKSQKDSFYSLLDVLVENEKSILKNLNNKVSKITNREIELVFFDSSTVYFETFQRDGLRFPGYSKDGKFKEDQVVLGMATDINGIPIHMKLFKGNTSDPNTFIPFILDLKQTYQINNITIISDKGMSTNRNIRFLEDLGINFIISYRAKSGSAEFKNYILDQNGYVGNSEFRYKEIEYKSLWNNKRFNGKTRRRIITYSKSRAIKDREDRKILINNFEKRQNKDGIVRGEQMFASKKYKFFKQIGRSDFELNYEKVLEDKKFDGIYVYETNRTDLTPQEVVQIYQNQWRIEENFRTLKTALKVRPVYVWTNSHIKGHFILCYLSLVIIKTIIHLLNESFKKDAGLIDFKITTDNFIKAILTANKIVKKVDNKIIETLFETNENNKKDFQNYVLIKKFTDFIHSKLDI
ncbi:IS1634 family transposase [Mycoplasmopsis felis]|uniref:IS1634 family transposase n=1 Tax=Mycoplasmopsis felis TaxID=33923 RepID=UPI003A4D4DBB